MVARRRLVAFAAAALILVRLATPAAAAPEPAAPEMEQFVDEVSSALGPFAPVVAEAFSAAAGDGEVWAAGVHPELSKPHALKLVQWFAAQLPTLKVLVNDLNRDLDPVRTELNAALMANSDWLRGELTTILPILFNIVCAVANDVLSPSICNLLINVLPGLAQSFWPIIIAFAPTVLALGGDFLPTILNFLIGMLSSASATSAASLAGEVEVAHVKPAAPYVQPLLTWLGQALTDPALSLLPILQAIAPVLGDVLVDAGRVLDWLSSQIGAIIGPIVELVCIIAVDVGIVNLGCVLKSLIKSMATNVIQGVIGTVRDWLNALPSRLGSPTAPSSTTTTTRSCFIFCIGSASAASVDSASGSGSGSGSAVGGELPETGTSIPLGILGIAISAIAGALWLFRRRVAAVGA